MTNPVLERPLPNLWDALSDYFDTTKAEDAIPAGAVDTMLIA